MMPKSFSWTVRLLFMLVVALASGACATMSSDYSESASPTTDYPPAFSTDGTAPSTNGTIQAP